MANPSFDELMHFNPYHDPKNGRFTNAPMWGSRSNPMGSASDFLKAVEEKRKEVTTFTDEKGRTYTGEAAVAKSLGMNTTQYRTQLSMANSERRRALVEEAKRLEAEGKNPTEIARIMGFNSESSVRSLLNQTSEARMNAAQQTAEFLKQQVEEKGMIDVGVGVERELGLSSREKLREALTILEMEGYPVYPVGIPQVTNPGQQSNTKVLCKQGMEYKDAYDFGKIRSVTEDWVSHDGGDTFDPKWVYPESMDSKRIAVRYGEDGGGDKEGVVEIRRGVKDLDLGGSHYAQVRILVDGTHYIKGMAVYADDKDLPDGCDLLINTKKSSSIPLIGETKENSLLKPIKKDPNNPFGALIKEGVDDPDVGKKGGGQSYYIDDDGKKKLSLINKKSDEGDWNDWSDTLPSQFLAKQSQKLIDRQLKIAMDDKKAEFNEIMSLTNNVVKKKYLKDFADDCDAAAVDLKAAALPRQKYQVLMPLVDVKEGEVYAPNYSNGEKVALIRYPHGGTFEIPILTVNNNNKEGQRVYGKTPKDVVAVHKTVADTLSGADFDGDTVMVIPCNSPKSTVKINSTRLKDIEGFDTQLAYGGRPEGSFKKMKNTQNEMGRASNLIMDMTLKGAPEQELVRAVKYSMVVIDAEKHDLDYQAAYKDFGIAELKQRWQGYTDDTGKQRGGASTLITRAGGEQDILKTKGSPKIDPETGKQTYKTALTEKEVEQAVAMKKAGKSFEEIADSLGKKTSDVKELVYVSKVKDKETGEPTGKTKVGVRTQKSTQMAETDDAFKLSTGTPQEEAYAEYANYMKSMANTARKEMLATPNPSYSPTAKVTYEQEVKSLKAKLNIAKLNAPRERQAQAMANGIVAEKKKADPSLTLSKNAKELKKVKQQALTMARSKTGAKRNAFPITDKEWEAIQSGAISANMLMEILNSMDADVLRTYAMPRATREISDAKLAKIRSLESSGYTTDEIASMVGISTNTINKYL